jgi:hypothetical protein
MPRAVVCEGCEGAFDRDAAAVIAVPAPEMRLLGGTAIAPSARDALGGASSW